MQLSELLDYMLGALLITMFDVIIMKKVFNAKLSKNKIKLYIALIFGSFVIAIINIENKDMFKPIFIVPILSLTVSYILEQKFIKCTIMTICCVFYLFISELILSIIMSLLNIQNYVILDNIFGSSIGNILVIIFAFPIIYVKSLKTYFNKLTYWFEDKKLVSIFTFILIFLASFLSRSAYKIYDRSEIITNCILTLTFIIIIYFLFNEFKKTSELSNNYNNLIVYLKTYEQELIEKRKIIHDYNNQLIIIKSYVFKKNKKLNDYLSLIMEDQKKITNGLTIKNFEKIPKGLQGLLYYKISPIINSVNIKFEIDEEVKTIIIPDSILKEYLKISGVFLDNAIESTLHSKEKELNIYLKLKNQKFEFKIENTFVDNIEKEKIYNSGYSTKGERRGYGLTLVKEIINKTDKIKIAINIIENRFIAIQIINV